MGTLRNIWSTSAVDSGVALASPGSVLITYDSDYINWPSLASKVGDPASSTFMYGNQKLAAPNAHVKITVASVRTLFGATGS